MENLQYVTPEYQQRLDELAETLMVSGLRRATEREQVTPDGDGEETLFDM